MDWTDIPWPMVFLVAGAWTLTFWALKFAVKK